MRFLFIEYIEVGLPGIEPGLHPPQGCVMPLYDSPLEIYLIKNSYSLNLSKA